MRQACLSLLLLCFAIMALADGGFFPYGSGAGANADQRALLVYDATTHQETLVVTTRYEGNPDKFAWVLPVPSLPAREQITTWASGAAAFNELYYLTEPTMRVYSGGSMGCMCAGAGGAHAMGDDAGDGTGLRVIDTLHLDGLEMTTLDAANAQAMATWLDDNGYRLPARAD